MGNPRAEALSHGETRRADGEHPLSRHPNAYSAKPFVGTTGENEWCNRCIQDVANAGQYRQHSGYSTLKAFPGMPALRFLGDDKRQTLLCFVRLRCSFRRETQALATRSQRFPFALREHSKRQGPKGEVAAARGSNQRKTLKNHKKAR